MQYHVIPLKVKLEDIRKQLEAVELEGWELVCVVPQPKALKGSPEFSEHLAYFKKPFPKVP